MSFWWNKKQGRGLGPIAGAGMAIIDDELSSSSSNPVKNSAIKNALDNKYDTGDSASTTINDTDYIPISDSGGNKKKALWSTIIDKIKAAVGTDAETVNGVKIEESGGSYGYYNGEDVFIPFKSQADIDAAVSAAKVGNATAADVLSGKTFTNSTTSGVTGSMTNNGAVSPSGLNCGGSYTIPAGYHNGSGKVNANSLSSQTGVDSGKTAVTAGTMVSGYQGWVNGSKISGTFTGQEKTVTAGTSAASVTPDSGKYLTKVTYNPTPSQTKSASSSTSAQTISPDSGKLLSSVSISAISPQRNLGTSATGSGIDRTGPFVYIPYGWWKEYSGKAGSSYAYMTAAQAVAACPSQTKTVTSSTSAQTVSPDSGKLLSKVTVNALTMSGTYTTYTNSSSVDMGSTNTYRYVNTTGVYNGGLAAGYSRNKYFGKLDWTGTGTSHGFTFSGLMKGGRYFYVIMVQQTGGTYSGVGSGAKSYATGSGITSDGNVDVEQVSCQSANTSGLGGMVMRSYGAFNSTTATSASIYLVTVNNITGYWCVYLWGSY